MSYKLRDRKQKQVYIDLTSSSESEHESDDPDYVNKQPRRPRPQRRQQRQENRNLSSSIDTNEAREVVLVAKIAGFPSTSQNQVLTSSTTTTDSIIRKRPRRPPKLRITDPSQENQDPLVTRRRRGRRKRRAPYTLRNYEEKRTVLAMLIDLKMIKENEGVYYVDMNNQRTIHGQVTRAGILCDCCGIMVTVSGFEFHAMGEASLNLGKPYQNIVLDCGGCHSLLQCQVLAWYKGLKNGYLDVFNKVEPNKNARDKSDEACLVCGDGGDLICCEKCPLTFHLSCLAMERVPLGDWSCPFCVCKYCFGSSSGEHYKDVSKCTLCEKTYHLACYEQKELDLNISCTLFCGEICNEIFDKLQRLVGFKNRLGKGLSWTLLRHADLMVYGEKRENSPSYEAVENNSKIAVVWTLMDLSFETIFDRHTNINILRSVIYNASSNLSRVNFKGFYTAILEKNDEIISAASLRIHGKKFAEMPFITTHKNYRGRGMLRKLLTAIESVENLAIPSAEGVEGRWINKFHFSQYIDKSLEKDIFLSNMLKFPRTIILQKSLLQNAQSSHIGGSNSRRMLPFDLNLEPPQENEPKL